MPKRSSGIVWRSNKEMQSRLLEHYTKDIQQHNWDGVTTIQSIMQFSRKKIVQTISRLVLTAMMREKDDEALDLLRRFDITVRNIRPIIIQSYRARAVKNWQAGKQFRKIYHRTPLDIGVLTWLAHEVFQPDRWKFQMAARKVRDTS